MTDLNVEPNFEGWLEWMANLDETGLRRFYNAIMDNKDAASKCFQEGHESRIDRLQAEVDRLSKVKPLRDSVVDALRKEINAPLAPQTIAIHPKDYEAIRQAFKEQAAKRQPIVTSGEIGGIVGADILGKSITGPISVSVKPIDGTWDEDGLLDDGGDDDMLEEDDLDDLSTTGDTCESRYLHPSTLDITSCQKTEHTDVEPHIGLIAGSTYQWYDRDQLDPQRCNHENPHRQGMLCDLFVTHVGDHKHTLKNGTQYNWHAVGAGGRSPDWPGRAGG